jgi:hypothetical protein
VEQLLAVIKLKEVVVVVLVLRLDPYLQNVQRDIGKLR